MYKGDHYDFSVADEHYTERMFEEEYSEVYGDYVEQVLNDDEATEAVGLNSERALDTLCLCGLRNRMSHGQLESKRIYTALDGSNVVLHRAMMDGKAEDITQSDLDILRAAITDYVHTRGGYNATNAGKPWPDGEDLLVTISPKRIHALLQLNHYDYPTARITQALARLAGTRVEGNYRVRSASGAKAHQINGFLFQLGIHKSAGGKRVKEYALLFDSHWGRAFMHNVRCGNLVKVQGIPYKALDAGAKQLFYIAMTMVHRELYRTESNLLQLMNIKEKQNTPRAIERLESYLKQLEGHGLITWYKEKGLYRIQRQYDSVKGYMPKV